MRVIFFSLYPPYYYSPTFTQSRWWLSSSCTKNGSSHRLFHMLFAEWGFLDFPNISRLHHDSDSSHWHTFIYKPLYKRERGAISYKFGSKKSFTANSRKVTLRRCNIFLELRPKGPLNTTHRTFLCITNLWTIGRTQTSQHQWHSIIGAVALHTVSSQKHGSWWGPL